MTDEGAGDGTTPGGAVGDGAVGDGTMRDGTARERSGGRSAAVPGFLPSTHAFGFTNSFPRQPVLRIPVVGLGTVPIGDASRGLCGGMIYAVRDMFEFGVAPPEITSPPAAGTALYRYIVRRLFDSFDIPRGVYRYYRLTSAADTDLPRGPLTRPGVGRISVDREWPRIRLDLDRGLLCPLGVITVHSADPLRLGLNHQVLAYAYEQRGNRVRLRVYDPNTPRARSDDVTLSFDITPPLEVPFPRPAAPPHGTTPGIPATSAAPVAIEHTISIGGRPVRAFFRSRYRRVDPRPALSLPPGPAVAAPEPPPT